LNTRWHCHRREERTIGERERDDRRKRLYAGEIGYGSGTESEKALDIMLEYQNKERTIERKVVIVY
jgi:hypothetical protein